jgi:hypothetical protein
MIDFTKIPREARESIDMYVKQGIPTGDAFRAILANDLFMAVCRLSPENLVALKHIAGYIYHECPSECHGSYEKVDAWLEKKRKERESNDAASDH